MKILMRIALTVMLLIVGFAAGFPIGQSKGFSTGSEWSFVQANILAREAGLFMPVNYEDGQFRLLLKQPKHLYRETWLLANRYEDEMDAICGGDRPLNERRPLIQSASLRE